MVVCATLASGCGDEDKPSAVSDSDLVSYLGNGATSWLQRQLGIALRSMDCSGQVAGSRVIAATSDARGCLVGSSAGISVRIQNVSRVPMTVYFRSSWASIAPGATQDYLLDRPARGQHVRYRLDFNAAASAALVSFLTSGAPASVEWRNCVKELTADCLISGLQYLLPQTIHVRSVQIPLARILSLIKTVWTYAPLGEALKSQITDSGEHQLTFA
jgi:hypothetical protein